MDWDLRKTYRDKTMAEFPEIESVAMALWNKNNFEEMEWDIIFDEPLLPSRSQSYTSFPIYLVLLYYK